MKKRSNKEVTLVASTNLQKNRIICQIQGKKVTKTQVMTVGTRTGSRSKAILETSKVSDIANVRTGSFPCITNKQRAEEKLITKLFRHGSKY